MHSPEALRTSVPLRVPRQVRAAPPPAPALEGASPLQQKAVVDAGSQQRSPVRPGVQALPDRYRVQTRAGAAFLQCVEAPTVSVRVERGKTVSAAAARSHPAGTIFLDGAAQGEPFTDPGRAIYNLDHHEGCVRAFTLATCEQAMVLVRKRLDLARRDWVVHINDADLDAVLAVWVLLNHLRLVEDEQLRQAVLPLLRLEGAIDAWGLEYQDLCGFPEELRKRAGRQMKVLHQRELAAKASGGWGRIALAEFVAAQLRLIDRMIYSPDDFEDALEVEELARCELQSDSIVVVCRSESGIYEVERQLRRFHGDRLGLIALQKDANTYSLRQVDTCLPVGLDGVYDRLNLVDPASSGSAANDRWGGSADIGGSPRASGTALSPEEIAETCRDAHRFGPEQRRRALIRACCASLLLLPAVALAASPLRESILGASVLGVSLFGMAGAALLASGHRRPGLYGLRAPRGRGGWLLLVAAAAAGWLASAGGAGALSPLLTTKAWLGVAAGCVGWELLFRGLVLGELARAFPIQSCAGKAFLSRPVLFSAGLSGLWVSAIAGLVGAPVLPFALLCAGLGIIAGFARERSESLLWAVAVSAVGFATLHATAWLG